MPIIGLIGRVPFGLSAPNLVPSPPATVMTATLPALKAFSPISFASAALDFCISFCGIGMISGGSRIAVFRFVSVLPSMCFSIRS